MNKVTLVKLPLKLSGEPQVTTDMIEAQAMAAIDLLETIDYSNTYGTCAEDRPRKGLLNGELKVETRPSAYGGPNVYGLYMAEMSGYFGNSDASSEERLRTVTAQLNRSGLKSGGHKGCAANAGFPTVIAYIANPAIRTELEAYARLELGGGYDATACDEAIDNITAASGSERYADWNENVLENVLCDEAGAALEVLVDGPHQAKVVIKVDSNGETVSQTKLLAKTGNYSYVLTQDYMDKIENALATGPEADRKRVVMRHARELLNAAIFQILPNPELHQANLSAK